MQLGILQGALIYGSYIISGFGVNVGRVNECRFKVYPFVGNLNSGDKESNKSYH